MDIFGVDARDVFDVGALAAAAGALAMLAAFTGFLTLVRPCQMYVARRHGPSRSELRSREILATAGWCAAGVAFAVIVLTSLIRDDPAWMAITLVSIMCGTTAGAAVSSYISSRRWYSWLARDPGAADLSPECRLLVSIKLGTRAYAITSWAAGLVTVAGVGIAASVHHWAAAALATPAVVWIWLVLLLLARRVILQVDPLTDVVRSYRALTAYGRERLLPLGARMTTDPWELGFGAPNALRRRLFECADLRLVRQVHALPHPARDRHRRGCGELLTDFAVSEDDPFLPRQILTACVAGPLPASAREPVHELGSAMKPWSAASRAAAIAVAVGSASAAVLPVARVFS